ncbi:MAG: hypothetical protein ABDH49_08015 [Candidatus Hydrothermales bacterium]
MKFFISGKKGTFELDFLTAAKILESSVNEKVETLPLHEYCDLLYKNKIAFLNATTKKKVESSERRGSNSEKELLKILKAVQKNSKQLTEDQEEYIKRVIMRLEEGALPKKTIKRVLKALQKFNINEIQNPLNVISVLQKEISSEFLKGYYAEVTGVTESKREVILSLYLS